MEYRESGRAANAGQEDALKDAGLDILRNMRKYLRNMRKITPLAALFPRTRRNVLAATFLQPERWWYLSELAVSLRTTVSSLQRDVRSMVASGIFERRQDGRRVYVRVAKEAAIFVDLWNLFRKTAGAAAELSEALRSSGSTIEAAFVYGSTARGADKADSDLDVIVIGRQGLSNLAPRMSELEKRLHRQVNLRTYSPDEFRRRLREKNHFLLSVLKGPKTFLKGGPNELESLSR